MKTLSELLVAAFIMLLAVLPCNAQEDSTELSEYMVEVYEAIHNDDYETAHNYLSKEVKENPKNIFAWCLLSSSYIELYENFDEALNCSNKAIKLADKNKKDNYSRSAAYAKRGDVYLELDKYDNAIKDYTIAIDCYPEVIDYYISRAICYKNLNKYDLFENDCKTIVSLDPEHIGSLMSLGSIAAMNDDFDKSIEYYSKVIKIDKDYSPAYTRRGTCYFALGKDKQSASDIAEAIAIDGNDEAFDFMLRMSTICFDAIYSEFNSRYDKYPQDPTWLYCIGLIYEYNKQYNQAIEYYEKAYEIAPMPDFLEIIQEVKKKSKE